jgi:hypothetical protein
MSSPESPPVVARGMVNFLRCRHYANFILDVGKRLNRGKHMAALIQEERLNEHGQPAKRHQAKRKVKNKNRAAVHTEDIDDDDNDDTFSGSDSEQDSDGGSETEIEAISNDEVRCSHVARFACVNLLLVIQLVDLLPSKTAPKTKRTKQIHAKKSRKVIIEIDKDSPQRPSPHINGAAATTTSSQNTGTTSDSSQAASSAAAAAGKPKVCCISED